MRLSYYTIDDLRLGHDPRGVTGWRLSQLLDRRDALEHYRSLPSTRVKEFGLSNGVQVLQLVRCLPLFPGDQTGHDVLLTDGIIQPLWRAGAAGSGGGPDSRCPSGHPVLPGP